MEEKPIRRFEPGRWKYALVAAVLGALALYTRMPASPPTQPIAFPHSLHLKAGVKCMECHRYAATSPQAGLPSARECALCHAKIRADTPAVRAAVAYARRGEEIPWQPVYGFAASAHVRFRHDMHVQSGIACSSCHGDLSQAGTARMWKPFSMGVCLSCHEEHGAGTECERCHY